MFSWTIWIFFWK